MVAAIWTIGGLFASLVGVLVLFRYGMPYRVRTGGADFLVTEQVGENARRSETLYSKLGWLGIVLVIFGTIAQILGAYLSAH